MTKSYVPPAAVQREAARGLALRKKTGRGGWGPAEAHRNGMGSGVVRAQNLASGGGLTVETVRRMHSFFARHDGAKERASRKENPEGPAAVAWALRGGDAGRAWVRSVLEKDDALPALREDASGAVLNEGLLSFVRDIATGDIEKEIDEIEGEVRDVHTPEQHRFVITKIVRLLERLIILRHAPGKVAAAVHDSAAWFQKKLGTDPGKELKLRTGEAIAKLARIRDTLLSKKWADAEDNQKLEELKAKAREILQRAERGDVDEE